MCGLVGYCSRRSLGFSNPSTCCRRLSSSLSLNFFIFKKVCAGFKGTGSVEKPTSPASPHQPLSPYLFQRLWLRAKPRTPSPRGSALLLAPAADGVRRQAATRLRGIPHGYSTGVAKGSTCHIPALPDAVPASARAGRAATHAHTRPPPSGPAPSCNSGLAHGFRRHPSAAAAANSVESAPQGVPALLAA